MSNISAHSAASLWQVFMLFAVPVGGGIPAGVLFAKSKGIGWIVTSFIYFLSDIALAIVFEPLMHLFIHTSRRIGSVKKVGEVLRQSTNRAIAGYGPQPGPFLLVLIAFGVDPMTGRFAAKINGHGFISGWAIAIVGDLLFFLLIMASTLWLNSILGDGTLTAVIIVILMLIVPSAIRRMRQKRHHQKK